MVSPSTTSPSVAPPPKPGAFRFKNTSKRASPPLSSDPDTLPSRAHKSRRHRSPSDEDDHSRRSSHRNRRHRRRRRHHTPDRSPPGEPPSHDSSTSADAAFRESLFDALADDEGAAFWEGVYGQPIHTYRDARSTTVKPFHDDGTANLEYMNDDEYVAYVRAQMWYKSHEHVLQERERLAAERAARKEAEKDSTHREREERARWQRRFDRHVANKKKKDDDKAMTNGLRSWKGVWTRYLKGWDELLLPPAPPHTAAAAPPLPVTKDPQPKPEEEEPKKKKTPPQIPWPTRSGLASNISHDSVATFFQKAPLADSPTPLDADAVSATEQKNYAALLKAERVRWHPDKMQQRAGGAIDAANMRSVTAVFQILDSLWSDLRERAERG